MPKNRRRPKPRQLSDQLCACGCGEFTYRASRDYRTRGIVKGEPLAFIMGHNSRGVHRDKCQPKANPEKSLPWEDWVNPTQQVSRCYLLPWVRAARASGVRFTFWDDGQVNANIPGVGLQQWATREDAQNWIERWLREGGIT